MEDQNDHAAMLVRATSIAMKLGTGHIVACGEPGSSTTVSSGLKICTTRSMSSIRPSALAGRCAKNISSEQKIGNKGFLAVPRLAITILVPPPEAGSTFSTGRTNLPIRSWPVWL